MSELISVIVPVYNAEQFLERCIESIRNQTYQNIEIVLIDDGSTDRSPELCEHYKETDRRIQVVHQSNGGPTRARKTGLKIASGAYIGFVDSDDWIDPDMYETLYHELKRSASDVVTSGYFREANGQSLRVKDSMPPGIYQSNDEKNYFFHNMIYFGDFNHRGMNVYLVTKLFKKQLIYDNFNRLDDRIQRGEDLFGVYTCLIHSISICVTNHVFYHYRMNDSSISHSTDQRYFESINCLYLSLKKQFLKSAYSQILLKQLDYLMTEMILKGACFTFGLNKECTLPYYIFPEKKLKPNQNIILYGAGQVGQSYFRQLRGNKSLNLILWVDEKSQKYKEESFCVESVDCIWEVGFDLIIIAIKHKDIAEKIREDLISRGIKGKKILWTEPKTIMENFVTFK